MSHAPTRPLTDAELAHEAQQESRAEDLAWEAQHRPMSEREIEARENEYERHLDRLGGSL